MGNILEILINSIKYGGLKPEDQQALDANRRAEHLNKSESLFRSIITIGSKGYFHDDRFKEFLKRIDAKTGLANQVLVTQSKSHQEIYNPLDENSYNGRIIILPSVTIYRSDNFADNALVKNGFLLKDQDRNKLINIIFINQNTWLPQKLLDFDYSHENLNQELIPYNTVYRTLSVISEAQANVINSEIDGHIPILSGGEIRTEIENYLKSFINKSETPSHDRYLVSQRK